MQFVRTMLAVALGLAVLAGLWLYPLPPWPLALGLAVYGALLWRWTGLWLVVIPALLPVYDLAPWSGWLVVGETDFFLLVTIAVLCLRAPPTREDMWPGRIAARRMAPFLAVFALAVLRGIWHAGPPGGSNNVYLTGWETVRLALPMASALVLLPFARARDRVWHDALLCFAFGMVVGLGLLSVVVIAERIAFPGLWDFVADYRVVGSFSSMYIGGGHIGTYIAFAVPFLSVCLLHRRWWSIALLAVVSVLAAYALLVTFARTAYGAAVVGALVGAYGAPVMAWFRPRETGTRRRLAGRLVPVLLGAVVLSVGLGTAFMSGRMETIPEDFNSRLRNWIGGLSMAEPGLVERVLGFGLGTYPRVAAAKLPADQGPSNFVLLQEGGAPVLSLQMKLRMYFGQKVFVVPGTPYTLRVRSRAPKPTVFSNVLCEKLALYSFNCRGGRVSVTKAWEWQDDVIPMVAPGVLHTEWRDEDLRPVEFSIGVSNTEQVEIAHISLTDQNGVEHIANGDFRHGMDRWFFTDDHHWSWRIFDQYLTTVFETGIVGFIAFLIFAGSAFWAAARRMAAGDPMAACVAPALAAIATSGLFDAVLEAPHLATLFYLVALFGLEWLDVAASRKLQRMPEAVIAAPSSTSRSNRSP